MPRRLFFGLLGARSAAVEGTAGLRMRLAAVLAVAVILGAAVEAARTENSEITNRRAAQRVSFSNEEILSGFLKVAFGAELQLDGHAERIRKFDEPVRVFVVDRGGDRGAAARRAVISGVVADIGARVGHLDIAVTNDRRAANVTVMLVPSRDMHRTIVQRYGRAQAERIEQSLNPNCLSGIAKDPDFRILRGEVLLPADADEFGFFDCAYEEILQSLGPINDDASVPWTMFNDEVQMGFFDLYDQYLLNILYDPRVRPGMTKEEFSALAPELLPDVRAFVARIDQQARLTPPR